MLQARGDLDGDHDVDSADLALMKGCFSGADVPAQSTPECVKADLDHDGDVDLSDFGLLQPCLTGPDMPATPDCFDSELPR